MPAELQREVDTEFGGLDGLLLAAAHRWYTALHAHLDAVLEQHPAHLPTAVAELWRALERTHPACRALLDAHGDRPVLATVEARQRRMLLDTTGVDLHAMHRTQVA
ncbi:MAG: hypothetical protein GEV09_12005 [Pseudonocardiaceae bacterium]|nr:hypothetical protein [Pseudonocardiaceae bacterium]